MPLTQQAQQAQQRQQAQHQQSRHQVQVSEHPNKNHQSLTRGLIIQSGVQQPAVHRRKWNVPKDRSDDTPEQIAQYKRRKIQRKASKQRRQERERKAAWEAREAEWEARYGCKRPKASDYR